MRDALRRIQSDHKEYEKIITYILESEQGTSLRASNFVLDDEWLRRTGMDGNKKE